MPVACWVNDEKFDAQFALLIIGAGAAGLCAALAAKEVGVEALLIERDACPVLAYCKATDDRRN